MPPYIGSHFKYILNTMYFHHRFHFRSSIHNFISVWFWKLPFWSALVSSSSRAVEQEHILPFLCKIPTPNVGTLLQSQCHACLHCLLLLCLSQQDPRGSGCPCLYSGCLMWRLRHGSRSVNPRSPHAQRQSSSYQVGNVDSQEVWA